MSYHTYTVQLVTEDIVIDLFDLSSAQDLADYNIFSTSTNMFNAPVVERQVDGLKLSYAANQQLSNFLSCHECLVDHNSITRKLNSQLSSKPEYDGALRVTVHY